MLFICISKRGLSKLFKCRKIYIDDISWALITRYEF